MILDQSIEIKVGEALRGRKWTLATAESCTAGLIAARLTDRPGSSDYVMGAVVSYSNEAKTDLLGVDAALIETHGAVSEPVAEAMATGALKRFGVDTAVAVTGIAGPGGGTPEKPVGTVCFTVMLGPSTPISPALFDYGIDAICGSVAVEPEQVLADVSEGSSFKYVSGLRHVIALKEKN